MYLTIIVFLFRQTPPAAVVRLHNSALTGKASLQSVREREQVSLSSVPSWRVRSTNAGLQSAVRDSACRISWNSLAERTSEDRASMQGHRVMAADSVVAPASRSPDTDFVPGCLIQLSTNICVPACASILSPIVAKSQASMWHAFLRRCMRIHSFFKPFGMVFPCFLNRFRLLPSKPLF